VNNTRNDAYLKAFGENLRKLRKKHGMTMMELAFEADIEYSQVAKIERGLINTTISTAYNLAMALGINQHELFLFSYPPKSKK
jgi:transcriptional regulator with XRE-family HTH domain